MGAIGYADNCMLLSPTITSMTHQLKICENYSKEYNLSFNVEKYSFYTVQNHQITLMGLLTMVYMSCTSWDFVQVITCTKSCTSYNLYG